MKRILLTLITLTAGMFMLAAEEAAALRQRGLCKTIHGQRRTAFPAGL